MAGVAQHVNNEDHGKLRWGGTVHNEAYEKLLHEPGRVASSFGHDPPLPFEVGSYRDLLHHTSALPYARQLEGCPRCCTECCRTR